ncbi:MAG: prepilin-type N-terminal cleavage/methylation domain-containing protein [Deltaproteobacteria bacterium]|nr:prepilin-type N-terminal cleavage/methylation domain-containing protein [Deltaproteobacteria bacterium]
MTFCPNIRIFSKYPPFLSDQAHFLHLLTIPQHIRSICYFLFRTHPLLHSIFKKYWYGFCNSYLAKGGIKVKNSLKSNGFTLIEVLISLVILAISLLALAGLMTTSTRNTAAGGRLTEAATLAQDKLEELRAIPWDSITPLNQPVSDSPSSRPGVQYTRSWVASLNALNPEIKEIQITISWTDVTSHSLRFFSALSK